MANGDSDYDFNCPVFTTHLKLKLNQTMKLTTAEQNSEMLKSLTQLNQGQVIDELFGVEGEVELKVFDTSPEHAKIYGLNSQKPMFVSKIFIADHLINDGIGNDVIKWLDNYAKKNGHDLIFGHIEQKSNPPQLKILLEKNGFSTIECNDDFYKYTNALLEGAKSEKV